METKLCLFVGCQKHTQNWRTNYCCPAHRRSHAGSLGGNAAKDIPKKQYGLPKPVKPKSEPKPKKTKEEIAAYHRQWAIEKQKRTKRATPKWADKDNIRAIYEEAVALTVSTGIKHEVDHIVPLTNKLVCGLHVEHNLRVVTFSENRSKSNKFIVG